MEEHLWLAEVQRIVGRAQKCSSCGEARMTFVRIPRRALELQNRDQTAWGRHIFVSWIASNGAISHLKTADE